MPRVPVSPDLIHWACQRSGLDAATLRNRFPRLESWRRGETQPTLRQLEDFAHATHTPLGTFFLAEPPIDRVPIPDFRTVRDERINRPSPDLLDTIYISQQRQEWYRDFARTSGEPPLGFVGSLRRTGDVVVSADTIRLALGFSIDERRQLATWTEALRRFIDQADALGILVMINGVVGSNNHRKLDPEEFRGFALSDQLAPLVFINGADTKAAQMFTLAHELAHIWLGESALSDVTLLTTTTDAVESWCNRVAAELLAPLDLIRNEYRRGAELPAEVRRLARIFKVSTLVVLRRIHDAGAIGRERFWQAYHAELARLGDQPRTSGGDFYRTTAARVGKRFARALVADTLEGNTLYRDACRMLGFTKVSSLQQLGENLGVVG